MSRTRFIMFATLLSLLLPFAAKAQTSGPVINAASCSQKDVNAVINGPTHTAVNGDTIVVPAGACTWTSGITVNGKGITILGTGTPNTSPSQVGAGTSSTTLINNSNGPFFTFNGLSVGQLARVSLFTMSASGASSLSISGAIQFSGTCTSSDCPNIRVDNITFTAGTWENALSYGMVLTDNVFGVVDHNTASEATAASPTLTQINFSAWKGVGSWGDNSFASAETFGTGQALYIENNLLNGVRGSENDWPGSNGGGGARYVCRFNTFNNMSGTGMCSAHGTAWSGRIRGQRQVEVYYNTGSSTSGCDSLNGLNSGTGRYLSNSFSYPGGGCNKFVSLDIARFIKTATPWNNCDGTQPWDQSPFSSSSQCIDQPGRGASSLFQGNPPVLASNSGTACSAVGQCWPNPALVPVYEAGEVMTSGGLGTPVSVPNDGSSTRLLANRDYYAEVSQSAQTSATSPFNGTTGTGYGTLARRPTSCTTGVGYWATDQGSWNQTGSNKGELFICTSSNTWTLAYTPYTYPHPLISGGTSGTGANVEAPTGLTATVQ